ncbi:universal stress protein [Aquimarina sp. MMG016]|uniref:universal stress protein n=1 Tax=Aquimarina sp. MMG016 TaxID=2822690 RepID=UPI001B3A0310|nr:universal stress protein [Aquimarina sp. MMG016]MBQ4819698.1 universal stress protein [Aquimarina sp. MMG016]
MKTILYSTDYSEHSISSLQYAYDLSMKLQAELIVLHIFDVPTFSGTTIISSLRQTQKRAYQEQRSIIDAYCTKHLGDKNKLKNVRTEVLKSISIVDGILEMAKKLSADMIIMGMKDKHSNRGVLVGDIAKQLLTKVPCPLLILPDNSSAKEIKNIVYATDFEEEDVFAIEKLAILAAAYQAEIRVIHISSKKESDGEDQMSWFKEMVKEKVDYENIDFDIVFSNDVYEKLNDYVNTNETDIVALLEREDRGFFNRLFHRDLVKQVGANTVIPLLSFNAK